MSNDKDVDANIRDAGGHTDSPSPSMGGAKDEKVDKASASGKPTQVRNFSTKSHAEAGARQGKANQAERPVKEMKLRTDLYREDFDDPADFNNFVKNLEVFGPGGKEDPLPGFRLQWVNDTSMRVPQYQQRGWKFVTRAEIGLNEKVNPLNKNLGDYVSQVVGTDKGQPLTAYLMKIENARWEQYQNAVARHNAQIIDQVRTGRFEASPEDRTYTPGDGQVPRSNLPRTQI